MTLEIILFLFLELLIITRLRIFKSIALLPIIILLASYPKMVSDIEHIAYILSFFSLLYIVKSTHVEYLSLILLGVLELANYSINEKRNIAILVSLGIAAYFKVKECNDFNFKEPIRERVFFITLVSIGIALIITINNLYL